VAGVPFSGYDSLLFQNFLILTWVRIFFKSVNPTPVQTPATIDATGIQQCFYLRNDKHKNYADSCNCRKYKVTLDLGSLFHKYLSSTPDLTEKCRIRRRDVAGRKFLSSARTAPKVSVLCSHRVRICCAFPCPRPHCTALHRTTPHFSSFDPPNFCPDSLAN